MYDYEDRRSIGRLRTWSGYKHSKFSFSLYSVGRKWPILLTWKSKFWTRLVTGKVSCCHGEKAIIIKHVLQSEILRLLVAITPLITVLIKIETCVSNFFCSMKESNIIEPMRLNVLSLWGRERWDGVGWIGFKIFIPYFQLRDGGDYESKTTLLKK